MKKLCAGLVGVILLGYALAHAALIFQTTNPADYIRTTNVTGAPTAYPLAMAFVGKITNVAFDRHLIQVGRDGTSNGVLWLLLASDALSFYFHNAVQTSSTATMTSTEGAWCFVGMSSSNATSHRFFVYNYETRTIAINETSSTSAGSVTTPNNYITIGNYDVNGTPQATTGFNGTMSWIAVYNRDFAGANGDYFKNLAHLGPYIHGAPVYLYSFNEMTGTTVRNRTTLSNNGTMNNFQASPWTQQGLPGPMPW